MHRPELSRLSRAYRVGRPNYVKAHAKDGPSGGDFSDFRSDLAISVRHRTNRLLAACNDDVKWMLAAKFTRSRLSCTQQRGGCYCVQEMRRKRHASQGEWRPSSPAWCAMTWHLRPCAAIATICVISLPGPVPYRKVASPSAFAAYELSANRQHKVAVGRRPATVTAGWMPCAGCVDGRKEPKLWPPMPRAASGRCAPGVAARFVQDLHARQLGAGTRFEHHAADGRRRQDCGWSTRSRR